MERKTGTPVRCVAFALIALIALLATACGPDRRFTEEAQDEVSLLPGAIDSLNDVDDPTVIGGPGSGPGSAGLGDPTLDGNPSGQSALLSPLGASCERGSDCRLGFCVDGTCCNTACEEVCAACNLEGSEGTCSPTPSDDRCAPLNCRAGTDCRGVDASQLDANCVDVGKCLEQAECETTFYEVGTPCQNETGTCDGAGACQVEGKLTLGASCASDDECAEGHCVATADGTRVCCDADCDGLCERCSAAGRCEEVPAHDPRCPSVACPAENVCRAYAGDLTENLCRGLGTCASSLNCEYAEARPPEQCTCDAEGACSVLHGNACSSDAECASGACETTLSGEGICCAAACPSGFSCSADGTQCEECAEDQRSCEGAVATRCEGGRLVRQSCQFGCSEGEGCNALPGVGQPCADDACSAGAVCQPDANGTNRCCVRNCEAEGRICTESGSCACPDDQVEAGGACQLSDGDPCDTPAQCESNNCVDGVCCREPCDGACERCEPGSGACLAVSEGQQDAACNGGRECVGTRGDCRLRLREPCDGDNAACASSNCEASILGGQRCCAVTCSAGRFCSADAQRCVECDASNQSACNNGCNVQQGNCNPLRPIGTACAQGRQCSQPGLCLVDERGTSRCCEANCAQQGKLCNSSGRCVCPAGEQEDQAGRCRRPNGEDCAENADCISSACESASGNNQPVCCAEACNGFELCRADGSACEDQRGEPGARCNAGGDCQNGNCVTGVCCSESCGECERCALGTGRCEPAPSNGCTLPGGAAGDCNGQGVCEDPRQRPGQSCNQTGDCQAGLFCTDEGVCCRQPCNGQCEQCGADGNCNVTPGRDPACGAVSCSSTSECVSSTPNASFRRCAALGTCDGDDPADCSETPVDDRRECQLPGSAGDLGVCTSGTCSCPEGTRRCTGDRSGECVPHAVCCDDCVAPAVCEVRSDGTNARCVCDDPVEIVFAGQCMRNNGTTCNQPGDLCLSGNCMETIRGFRRCCIRACEQDELCNLRGGCGRLPGGSCQRNVDCANDGFISGDACVNGVCQ